MNELEKQRAAYRSRAAAVKDRVYRVYGWGGIARVSEELDISCKYLSNVLSARYTARPTLDRIEAHLTKIENA